ncbi:transmembrane protein 87A-like [Carassius carassius]|uniref:transmembrane protein 87A-like n=1 Tax=Carassius carassius TaxID=217509 RepID=UPI002868F344|nr:transmembrane protein 87A-like [Carassius carassius]
MATVTNELLVSGRFRGVLLVVILQFVLIPQLTAISEPGKWVQDVDIVNDRPKFFYFPKTMFNNTFIEMNLYIEECADSVELIIAWHLRSSPCYNEVFGFDPDSAEAYFESTTVSREGVYGFYIDHKYEPVKCESNIPGIKFGVKDFDHPKQLESWTQVS